MSARGVLRVLADRRLAFWCPGCEEMHVVTVASAINDPGKPGWSFNGDFDRPTFTPSVLVTTGRAVDPTFVPEPGDPPEVCHSFVTDGQIQFLGDSTHALAGQTVALRGAPQAASAASKPTTDPAPSR